MSTATAGSTSVVRGKPTTSAQLDEAMDHMLRFFVERLVERR
jgi:hypothetical protein